MAKDHISKVGNVWKYVRRVPSHYAHLDSRGMIRQTTRQYDQAAALIVAKRLDRINDAYWAALVDGQGANEKQAYDNAVKRAIALGFQYKTNSDLAGGELTDIFDRLEFLEKNGMSKDSMAVSAVLGGLDKPDYNTRLNGLLEDYMEVAADTLLGKSPEQLKRWTNPRKKAIRNLTSVIGNKMVREITRHDALDFKTYWMQRVKADGLDIGTANKDMTAISRMVNEISDAHRLELGKPFSGMRLRGERHTPMRSFSPEFVQDVLLEKDALKGLNTEAQMIFYIKVWTGLRTGEIVNLRPEHIILDAPIPYLKIRATKHRSLKTHHSRRDMPLVSGALEAMHRFPNGFPTYAEKSDRCSAVINKFMKTHGLRPAPVDKHVFNSLRHTFQFNLNINSVKIFLFYTFKVILSSFLLLKVSHSWPSRQG